jgi:hypothetical protein
MNKRVNSQMDLKIWIILRMKINSAIKYHIRILETFKIHEEILRMHTK